MDIIGLNQLQKHLPELSTPFGMLRLFLIPILLSWLIAVFFSSIRFSWLLQVVAEILLGSLGFGLLYLFFRYKQDFRARFGPLAYSHAARWFGFPAVTMIAALIVRLRYLNGPQIPWFSGYIILQLVGWALIVMGTLLALRTILIFGLDNLVMLYVYFPEESHFVNHKIYSILRHPAYAAVLLIAFGLALLNGGWAALACAVIFALGVWGWVRLVEEKELIKRFGVAYVEYRKRVPAFGPHPHDLWEFFRFLILGR